jgi:hypothetical protein
MGESVPESLIVDLSLYADLVPFADIPKSC